jgi:hypothetical protein
MGHPYAHGWRAIMRADIKRRNRRILLTGGGVIALAAIIADGIVRAWGAW